MRSYIVQRCHQAITERTSAGSTDEKKRTKMTLWLTCVLLMFCALAKSSMGKIQCLNEFIKTKQLFY